jgi:hypothetical protein
MSILMKMVVHIFCPSRESRRIAGGLIGGTSRPEDKAEAPSKLAKSMRRL